MILHSKSDSETKEIGRRLGVRLGRGDIVCLYGDLGAGKTTITKGIAAAFGINERDITSASFTIIAEYDSDIPFYHIDLYRLAGGDTDELGLHEYFESDGVAVIEWAEKAKDEIPDDHIGVNIEYEGEVGRKIEITGIDI